MYWVGVLLAIIAGSSSNFGAVLQKKVVNELPPDSKFMRSLLKNPLWLLGLCMGLVIGSMFFMIAQVYIGPALVPGLMASGLIVLAIGSVKIVHENLKKEEIIAIIIMIMAIFLIGISELSIEIAEVDFLETGFIIRISIFTGILLLLAVLCEIFQRKSEKYRGIFLAILSGFMFSLSNFWISPLLGVITHIFGGIYSFGELILFIFSCVILILANIFGIGKIQESFKVGQASNLIPIQQVSIQITPVFVYLLVFLRVPPSIISIVYLLIGITLILISSFLLGKRQAQLEEIK
jgi:drug/metabolite transporter (DMT)-like permease